MKMKCCLVILLVLLSFPACLYGSEPGPEPPQTLGIKVLAVYPHDQNAFTQGLIFHEGRLYESTGLYGNSDLRQVDRETGEVLRKRKLPEQYFGEGLASNVDRLVQLTWQEGTAFVYDLHTFNLLDHFSYEGEGWGLCFDGESFFRSDGSGTLYLHDSHGFRLLETRKVTLAGRPVHGLNDLACAGSSLYANVYMTDRIYRIDGQTGGVSGIIDAGELLSEDARRDLPGDAVLNGIAHDPEGNVFYLTGKRWPKLFMVRFTAP